MGIFERLKTILGLTNGAAPPEPHLLAIPNGMSGDTRSLKASLPALTKDELNAMQVSIDFLKWKGNVRDRAELENFKRLGDRDGFCGHMQKWDLPETSGARVNTMFHERPGEFVRIESTIDHDGVFNSLAKRFTPVQMLDYLSKQLRVNYVEPGATPKVIRQPSVRS